MNAAEKKALVDLLENGEYETAGDLAVAVYDKVIELLSERGSYGIRLDLEGTSVAFGPWYHKTAATKALKQVTGGSLRTLRAPAALNSALERRDAQSPICARCLHHKSLHVEGGCCSGLTYVSTKPFTGTKGRACGCMG